MSFCPTGWAFRSCCHKKSKLFTWGWGGEEGMVFEAGYVLGCGSLDSRHQDSSLSVVLNPPQLVCKSIEHARSPPPIASSELQNPGEPVWASPAGKWISKWQSRIYKYRGHWSGVLPFALIILKKKKKEETVWNNSQKCSKYNLFYQPPRDDREISETLCKRHFRFIDKRCCIITKTSSAFAFQPQKYF